MPSSRDLKSGRRERQRCDSASAAVTFFEPVRVAVTDWRVSSPDEHYSKEAKASDETDRSRGGRTTISGRRSGRRATQNKHARPLRVLDAAQGTLLGYGTRHARQAEHVSWRLGIR